MQTNQLEMMFPRSENSMINIESSRTVINDLCNGIIKDPFVFDCEIHEKCPTPRELTDDKRKRVDRFWKDAYLESLNKAVSHVQDWFTKISFKNKLKFTGNVIELMVDSRKLFDLAYFIGPPKKDWVYAHTQFTRSSSDVAATDHNRALDDSTYTQASFYLEWFQPHNPREQFDVVIGLIHLGGTALEENIYGQVVKILNEKERDVIRKRVLQYLSHKRKLGSKFIASKVTKHKLQPPKTARQRTLRQLKSDPSGGDDDVALLQEKIAEYNNAIKSMQNASESVDLKTRKGRRETNKKRKKSKSASPGLGYKKLDRLNAGLDRVQMLPLWDNRRIMAMLSDKSISGVSKVNKYWTEMVGRTKKEMKVRKRIDKFLRQESYAPIKGHKYAHKGNKTIKNTGHSGETSHHNEEIIVPEDYYEHLDAKMVFTDEPHKLKPFSNLPETYVICTEYCDGRSMDANKRWAAYSKNTDLEFSNVVFGVPCNIKLENAHRLRISCVFFHPTEKSLVFTGGHDGLVKLHDIWKKAVKVTYAGHNGIVSDVVANCRYVASCGMDNTVLVFNISDGRSLMCLADPERPSPCRLLMTNCAYPLLYVAHFNGEILMYRVRETSSSQRKIGKTVYAHNGEVTCINHYPCVLLTTGVDGFARMWATNFEKPLWILSLQHPTRVNSAAMSYRKIITAGEDGKLRIWDVMSEACEKTMSINAAGRPILSMRCIQEPYSVKIVLNNEADIRVVEFLLRKPAAKKHGRSKSSKLKPIGDFKKKLSPVRPAMSSYEKRMMKMQMRQAVIPTVRLSQKLPSPEISKHRQNNFELNKSERLMFDKSKVANIIVE